MRLVKQTLRSGALCLVLMLCLFFGAGMMGEPETVPVVKSAPAVEDLFNTTPVVPPKNPAITDGEEYGVQKFLAMAGLVVGVVSMFVVPAAVAIIAERSSRRKKEKREEENLVQGERRI